MKRPLSWEKGCHYPGGGNAKILSFTVVPLTRKARVKTGFSSSSKYVLTFIVNEVLSLSMNGLCEAF